MDLNLVSTLKYNMKLTDYSRNRILETFAVWNVPKDFADPMYNYLVYGYQPGSCFTAVLANDFIGAMRSSHPANTVNAFKSLAGWLNECCPKVAQGSYTEVEAWCDMSSDMRRSILEKHRIVYTEKEEVWMALKDEPSIELVMY